MGLVVSGPTGHTLYVPWGAARPFRRSARTARETQIKATEGSAGARRGDRHHEEGDRLYTANGSGGDVR